jgi:amino acid transporter
MADVPTTERVQTQGTLRRELRFWEAIALSIGIMAPMAAMALNGVVPASLVGRAVPLAFLFAAIGVLFVSYAFIRLTRYFAHAGSAYALTGATLGPRAGFFTGWTFLGVYSAFTAASCAEVGLFGSTFLQDTGIWSHPEWIILALAAAALIWVIAYGEVKYPTRTLLVIEAVSVVLITILVMVIFAKVIGGSSPRGQDFSLKVFSVPSGVSVGTVALASVFGFLSWAGFEGAASLGEETNNPRRNIPYAIAGAVGFTGVFYVIVMMAQTLGFGIDKEGVDAFSSSSSPLGDLSKSYMNKTMADAIDAGATVSAFASALGTATAGSRMLFAMTRDGFISRRLGQPSPRTGSPANALAVVMVAAVTAFVALRINGTTPANAFFYAGTIGVLAILVGYIVTNLGALRFLFWERRVALWQAIVPVTAIAILVYVIYKNVHPKPAHPYDTFPYVVLGWLVIGVLIAFLVPGLARSIGGRLTREELGGESEAARPPGPPG